MRLSINLVETDSQIRSLILQALAEDVNDTLIRSVDEITDKIKELLISALKQEPEYASLISGKLKAELGLPNPNAVDSIIDKLSDTISIRITPVRSSNTGLTGGLSITGIFASDIGGLIGDPDGIIDDTDRGYSLPWLEWLTLRGTESLVKDFKVSLSPGNPFSRSGMAVMVSDEGSEWSVPAEFAGVIDNNWITRAIERMDKQIQPIIIQTIEKNI